MIWREGRPFARTVEIAAPLGIESDQEYVDLTLALARTRHRVRLLNGVVEIESAVQATVGGSGASVPRQADREALVGPIESVVQGIEVDEQSVRAEVLFSNSSDSKKTEPREVTCYFTRGGSVLAQERMVLPALGPEESYSLVFYRLHRGALKAGEQPETEFRFAEHLEREQSKSAAQKMMSGDRAKKTYSTRARSWRKF
ncbi:MAG: hypothetical protein KC910_19240 [Candidatus Eremiobacteraeota bacterium]|nr:hypothetical protein [Candidatus Eremiobacteraeota bacterium]